MAWFTEDVVDFFRELELDNSRTWFEANKKRYERSVKKPMEAFAAELIERMKRFDPDLSMQPKDALFRIHRDIRFSKDKSPYKTNSGLSISRGGKHGFSTPGVYFHVDARSMGVASGMYMLEPAQIKAVREHIVAHPDELAALQADPRFVEAFGEIRGERNKILPPEFRAAATDQPVLFNKQFYYWSESPAEDIVRDDLADFVMSRYEAARPMNAFFERALGVGNGEAG